MKNNYEKKTTLKARIAEIEYHTKRKEYNEANYLLRQLEKNCPDNPYVIFEVGKTLAREKKYEEAEMCFNRLKDYNNPKRLDAMYELIGIYRVQKRFSEAKNACFTLINSNYKEAESYLMLGDIEQFKGNRGYAKKYYKESVEYGLSIANSRLSEMAIKAGQYKLAAILQSESEFDGHELSLRELQNKINVSIYNDQYSDAEHALSKLEDKLSSKKQAQIYFAIKSYIKIGKGEYAHKIYNHYQRCLQNNVNNTLALIALAQYDGDNVAKIKNLLDLRDNHARYASKANYILGLMFKQLPYPDTGERYFADGINNPYYIDENNYFELIYLYMRQGKYEQIGPYLEKVLNSKSANSRDKAQKISVFLDHKFGREISEDRLQGYLTRQIVNYDKDLALEHIKGHTIENDTSEKNCFKPSIDIKELYEELQPQLNEDSLVDYDICDTYIIPKDKVGSIGDKDVDYVAVTTITGTKDIITMFPVASKNYNSKKVYDDDNNEEDVSIDNTKDVSDEKEEANMFHIEPEKVKTISAIDKFNKRWGLK